MKVYIITILVDQLHNLYSKIKAVKVFLCYKIYNQQDGCEIRLITIKPELVFDER